MINNRKFKVLKHKDFSGLTVGNYSRKPGYIFTLSEWKGSEESLDAAIKNERCVEIIKKKKEEKKKDSK